MQTRSFFSTGLFALGLIVTGCASTPDPTDDRTLEIGEDGAYAVLDGDGNPVDDPELERLGQALAEGLAKTDPNRELSNDEIWSVDAAGNLTHIQSGGICPLRWGEFVLNKPTIFKRNGMDVGCNFQSESLRSSFTFYFYTNSESPKQELDGVMSAIKSRNPNGRDVALNYLGPEPQYVGAAIESVEDGAEATRDAILLTEDDGWRIKLRMTYPAEFAVEREHLAAIMLQGQIDRVNRNGMGATPDEGSEPGPALDT